MGVPFKIQGGSSNRLAEVTSSGELVVSARHYDETVFNELAEDDTAYNFYGPLPSMQFVITGIIAYADKQVSAVNNATVIVYEAEDSDVTDVSKVLMQFELGQNQSLPATPLRILVNKGVWVNAQTDDDDIHMTILGYYIDEV